MRLSAKHRPGHYTSVAKEKKLSVALPEMFYTQENILRDNKRIQGVGKSKLALHLAELYQEQGYYPIIVGNGPFPIWEDLNNFILRNEKYIILVDDANNALYNLKYLHQLTP